MPHVLVSSGRRLKQKVLYEPALQDLEQVESRLLATATSYINRYERYLKVKSLDELVDRMELLTRLYGLELQYQWEKFQLVEAYYYAYENTKEPLQAYKLSRTILALILKPPAVDLSQTSFEQSYRMNIEALKTEAELVRLLTHQLERAEEEKCRVFHDKLARTMSIPLTLQAFLYGDLEKRGRGTGTKMQRMNSMTSKLSKESRNENKLKPEMEIREHVQEEDSDEESFDLENYDEYLLRKNMDAIFDDMIGGDENGHLKEASPVNTVALENIVVNPRFEGGPHIRTKIHPELPVTSQKRQHLVNFSETLYVVGNIRQLVESLREEFEKQFGYCCELYQLVFMRQLTQRMLKGCLQPEPLPPRWLTFETDDAYLETVTKSMRYYEETMAACLEPPSNVQLAIPATHERHHDKLPLFGALQYFDYHSIHSLVQLKKPINAFRYKEHNLGLNFLELLELEDRLWEVQLQRRGLSRAYQSLGRHCELTLEKSLTEYTNSGQSEVFMSTQEVKMYNPDIARHAVFSDML